MGLSLQSQASGWPYLGLELVKHGCYRAISQKEPGCSQRNLVLLIMTCDWTESGVPWQTTESPLRKLRTPGPGLTPYWSG